MRSLRPLLILLVLTLPSAAAQDPSPEAAETWDTPRHIDGLLHVANNTTITVRGTWVELGTLRIDAGSRLILESTPDAAAELRAATAEGWNAAIIGHLILRGTAEHPVVLDGIGGTAVRAGDTLTRNGGFVVAGPLDATHVTIRNYTSGIFVSAGEARFDHLEVDAIAGVGLSVSGGTLSVENATLQGPNATVASSALGHLVMRHVTLSGADLSVIVNGLTAELHDVRSSGNIDCVAVGGGDVVVAGLECTDFEETAIRARPAATSTKRPNLDIRGLLASTSRLDAHAALRADTLGNLSLHDSILGPLPRAAVWLEETTGDFANVTFREVGGVNYFLVDHPGEPGDWWREGDAGKSGRLFVGYHASARILGVSHTPEPAYLEYWDAESGNLLARHATQSDGSTVPILLPTMLGTADEEIETKSYRLRAQAQDGSAAWTRDGFVPDGAPLLVQLEPIERLTPMGTGVLFLAIVVGVAIARRR